MWRGGSISFFENITAIATVLNAIRTFSEMIKHPILYFKENKQIKGHGFYFNSITKHVTIYNNGHGIMINDHDIMVTNKELFTTFKRKVDISDGKSSAKFPSFKHIKNTHKSDRFTAYGFWEYSKDGIITDSFSDNWDKSKKSKKKLIWTFNIDHNKIRVGRTYNLGYVISIPGMFRIDEGYAENAKGFDGKMCSSINVTHKAKVLHFDVSFEDGIKLESVPVCNVYSSNDSERGKYIPVKTTSYNALYNKYSFEIKNPRIGNVIEVTWKVQKNNN